MAVCGGTDDFCGGGVSRPAVDDTRVGQDFLDLLGKADKRTQELYNLMSPLLRTASGQAGDILAGGSGAFTPAIQSAMGQAQGTLSNALSNTSEQLSRMGITGTSAASILSDAERQGGQQIAGIPSQFTTPVLQGIFQALTGTPGLAVQGQTGALGAAGGVTGAQIQPVPGRGLDQYWQQATNMWNSMSSSGVT